MKNLRSLLIVPAMLVLVGAAAIPTVSAEEGSGGATNANHSHSGQSVATDVTASSQVSSDEQGTSQSGNKAEIEQENEHRANAMVKKLQSKRHDKQQNGTARTKKCEAAKNGLQKRLTNLQKNAAKHKALIDKVYNNALSYQQQNNLNPAGFNDLVNAANTDQAKAAASVAALDNLSVNLDCNSSTVATNVANFKTAAQQAKNDLLSYRNSVKAVLRALQTAKQQGGQ